MPLPYALLGIEIVVGSYVNRLCSIVVAYRLRLCKFLIRNSSEAADTLGRIPVRNPIRPNDGWSYATKGFSDLRSLNHNVLKFNI